MDELGDPFLILAGFFDARSRVVLESVLESSVCTLLVFPLFHFVQVPEIHCGFS